MSAWLQDEHGAASELTSLTQQHRDPAAHIEPLSRKAYVSRRAMVLGSEGIPSRLAATFPSEQAIAS